MVFIKKLFIDFVSQYKLSENDLEQIKSFATGGNPTHKDFRYKNIAYVTTDLLEIYLEDFKIQIIRYYEKDQESEDYGTIIPYAYIREKHPAKYRKYGITAYMGCMLCWEDFLALNTAIFNDEGYVEPETSENNSDDEALSYLLDYYINSSWYLSKKDFDELSAWVAGKNSLSTKKITYNDKTIGFGGNCHSVEVSRETQEAIIQEDFGIYADEEQEITYFECVFINYADYETLIRKQVFNV